MGRGGRGVQRLGGGVEGGKGVGGVGGGGAEDSVTFPWGENDITQTCRLTVVTLFS